MSETCPLCDDSGYQEFVSGGIWTGENITTRREFCDCACGQDARDQTDGVGFHAARAQEIEARRAETQGGSVHESAVATPCAQSGSARGG
jgi:hypothetical protein